ncbi:hypothetical protein LCGC14_1637790 [marine sediment metagenome]|uniref:UDP-N-acetylglucosamine 2-epimerase domain-containing protein n=1 Tax=marine sediment metagenome TaxID=412755 RepID=A0A0F9L023_9ZZZZ
MKDIIFVTGTRADFGHLRPLIDSCISSGKFNIHIFVTGTHVYSLKNKDKYRETALEISEEYGKSANVTMFYNGASDLKSMSDIASSTIMGFSKYIEEVHPDLVVIFGDRIEQLGAAISSVLENILTIQIEAGDVTGTIDESLRHSITKLCHAHFVANEIARNRVIQMGEKDENVFIIGAPSLDIILKANLIGLEEVKKRYGVNLEHYSILIFHPVTTEYKDMEKIVKSVVDAILESEQNFIVIGPNSDSGSNYIWDEYKKRFSSISIKVFSSLSFIDYLILLKNADFIIGNSSSGVIEAPYFGVPTVNIGSRQNNRTNNDKIINCGYGKYDILRAIEQSFKLENPVFYEFGDGDSGSKFVDILNRDKFWRINKQKKFIDNN